MALDKAHCESHFESYIVDRLVEQGWLKGVSANYNADYAVYTEDLMGWIQDTQPKAWQKLVNLNGDRTEKMILDRLESTIEKNGMITTFRKGIQIAGAGSIKLTESSPEDKRNDQVIEDYKANRLRVVPQLRYNPNRNLAIDLVLFINGLPMATVEIKTEFNQTIDDAIQQYKQDRLPFIEKIRRKEPLLTFNRGAIVHFAMTESLIYMTTKLNGEDTFFLPFNKGCNGGAGNPIPEDKGYATSYFWEQVCKPENWLKIFHDFIFIDRENVQNLQGDWSVKETLIFPRYHQFDAVLKMLADAKEKGVGQSYLCEHSAGSGKTSTISWTTHGLTKLRKDDGTPYFNTIVIVTDRTVLDNQLQEAIQQIDHQQGLIAAINRESSEAKGKSKSKQLEEALLNGRQIVVVTIQTFPHAMEAILTNKSLSDRNFAIVVDEAHTSQTGSTASKLQATLALKSTDEMGSMTVEEILEHVQRARSRNNNISFFAFTATPKHSTLTLFGRPADPTKPLGKENLPTSFHLYPMRQAIEEGFILDVLKGYVHYDTAFKFGGMVENDKRVNKKAAKQALARWLNLHSTNVTQKVDFIIQHFHRNVAHLLNGEAKAMVVTSSRPAAVRYKLAFEKYLSEHGEFKNYRVLVAFSGTLNGKQIKHDEDEGDLFNFPDDEEFTEYSINDQGTGADLAKAFDRPQYRLMVVANKFQTGFDQPKICAMYLDKKIGNEVEVVQTLSRLNRTYRGKDKVFIVDFVNDPQWIKACFKKYDSGAEIEDIQDLNVIYNIKDQLDEANIYMQKDLEEYKKVRYETARNIIASTSEVKNKSLHLALVKTTQAPAKVYNDRIKALVGQLKDYDAEYEKARIDGNSAKMSKIDAEREEADVTLQKLSDFKGNLARFSRFYYYIAQLVDFGDSDLELFASFSELLAKKLHGKGIEEIDISGLALSGFSLTQTELPTEEVDVIPLMPIQGEGKDNYTANIPKYLQEIIEEMNQDGAGGEDVSTRERVLFAFNLKDAIARDKQIVAQIRNNTPELALEGNLSGAVIDSIIKAMDSNNAISEDLLRENSQSLRVFIRSIEKMIRNDYQFNSEDF